MKRTVLLGLALLLALLAGATTAGAASKAARGCERTFNIIAPSGLKSISGTASVQLVGSACDGDRIMLLERTGSDASWHRDNDNPLEVIKGRWRFSDKPIGSKKDAPGTVYTIVAVRASRACVAAIKNGPADRGLLLPKPCPSVTGTAGIRMVQVKRA